MDPGSKKNSGKPEAGSGQYDLPRCRYGADRASVVRSNVGGWGSAYSRYRPKLTNDAICWHRCPTVPIRGGGLPLPPCSEKRLALCPQDASRDYPPYHANHRVLRRAHCHVQVWAALIAQPHARSRHLKQRVPSRNV